MADQNDEWTFRITLVRHGETTENRNRIIQGQKDTVLNENGQQQVRLVSKRLKHEYFTRVFTSDLQRALKTAEGIVTCNRYCTGTKISVEPLLRERSYGVAEGKPCAELKKFYQHEQIPDKAETAQELHERAVTFFARLLGEVYELRLSDEGVPVHILLVSHGGWIRSLIKHFAQDFPSHFPVEKKKLARQGSPNTGLSDFKLTLIDKQVKNLECLQLYDKSHLI